MNLEGIILRKISQTEKDKYRMTKKIRENKQQQREKENHREQTNTTTTTKRETDS